MVEDSSPSGVLTIDLNERLHVDVGTSCNNNCIFCMEEDRKGRQQRVERVTPEDVAAILLANRFRREVVFVSGEPTLAPRFLDYVKWASEAGYERVGVISNGQRFAYAPWARAAVEAGLNHVIVSIHGSEAKIHDGLTRTPGSYNNTLKGILHLSALKRRYALRLDTSTVLNRRNSEAEELERLLQLLKPHVDQMVFNIMQPFGRGKTHMDRLMLRYTEMGERLGAFFRNHPGEELPVVLVDIPYCTTEGRGIPDSARGYVERYVHFEADRPAGKPGPAAGTSAPILAASSGGAPVKKAAVSAAPESDGHVGNLSARTRDQQEQTFKMKPDSCNGCVYFDCCDGVWRNYVDCFGLEEFQAVHV
jgi:cyclic pyranopterin phosphate synthase